MVTRGKLANFGIVFLPFLLLVLLIWMGAIGPLRDYRRAQNLELTNLIEELQTLKSKISKLDTRVVDAQGLSEFVWTASEGNSVALNIQSTGDGMARAAGFRPDLIGPYGSDKNPDYITHAVELETDTSYEHLLKFLDRVEAHNPPLGVSHLSVRPFSQGQGKTAGTPIYFRAVIWGYESP